MGIPFNLNGLRGILDLLKKKDYMAAGLLCENWNVERYLRTENKMIRKFTKLITSL